MALGGKRPGAGRKKGVPDKKTRNMQLVIAKGGKTPLEQMIEAMRFFSDAAARELSKGKDCDERKVTGLMKEAATIASQAAPYVHPRLATVDSAGKGLPGGQITVVIQGVDAGLL